MDLADRLGQTYAYTVSNDSVSGVVQETLDSSTSPALELVGVADGQSPNQDDYVYDGLGRVVEDASMDDASLVSTTITVHSGDSTTTLPPVGGSIGATVTPPAGGVTKTTVTDPMSRTSAVEEYSAAPTVTIPSNTSSGVFYLTGGTPDTTTTTYGFDTTPSDATYGDAYTTTTDADNDKWTSYTDLAGNVVEKADPTAGVSTMTYDADGNLTLAPFGFLVFPAISLFAFRYASRSKPGVAAELLIVDNAFKSYALPLSDVQSVSSTRGGLRIGLSSGETVLAGAVQNARRAENAVYEIFEAKRALAVQGDHNELS